MFHLPSSRRRQYRMGHRLYLVRVSTTAYRCRAFQIPEEYCQRYGYPQLTGAAKEKILGLNAARIYGIDPAQAKVAARNDDLAWLKAAIDEYKAKGLPIAS